MGSKFEQDGSFITGSWGEFFLKDYMLLGTIQDWSAKDMHRLKESI